VITVTGPVYVYWFMDVIGSLQRSHNNTAWQSWKPADHPSLWLLWWVLAEIWKCKCVEIFYWSVWLSATDSSSWWTGIISYGSYLMRHYGITQCC